MATVKLMILIADEYQDRILEVIENLQSFETQIDQVMAETGVIIGEVETTKVELLKTVEGIAVIEPSQNFQLAPPESDAQ